MSDLGELRQRPLLTTEYEDLSQWGGNGLNYYFLFQRVLMLSNVLCFAVSSVEWIVLGTLSDYSTVADMFFSSDDRGKTNSAATKVWILCCLVQSVYWIVLSFVYRSQVKNSRQSSDRRTSDAVVAFANDDPFEMSPVRCPQLKTRNVYYAPGKRLAIEITDHHLTERKPWTQILRKPCSLCLLAIVIGVYCLVQYKIQDASIKDTSSNYFWQIAYVMFHLIFKQIWRLTCLFLTWFEDHEYLDEYYRWYLLKLFAYDWSSYLVFCGTRYWLLPQDCVLGPSLFLIYVALLLWELVLVHPWQVLVHMSYNYLSRRLPNFLTSEIFQNGVYVSPSTDSLRLPFDLAEEYARVLFKQLLITLSSFLFPLAPLLGLLGCFLEHVSARFRITRLCSTPRPSASDFTRMIQIVCTCNAVFSCICYPGGMLWIVKCIT